MAMEQTSVTACGFDCAGVVCSLACAGHCAAAPVLLSICSGVSAAGGLYWPVVQPLVLLVCCFLVSRSIVPGFRRHGEARVLLLATCGLILPVPGTVLSVCHCPVAETVRASSNRPEYAPGGPEIIERTRGESAGRPSGLNEFRVFRDLLMHPWMPAVSGLFLAAAHLLNLRLCRREHWLSRSAC